MSKRVYGSKYNSELNTVQIAGLIREDIKAAVKAGILPKGKYSVRSHCYSGGSSITMEVVSIVTPIQVLLDTRIFRENRMGVPSFWSPAMQHILRVLGQIAFAYSYSEWHQEGQDTKFFQDEKVSKAMEDADRAALSGIPACEGCGGWMHHSGACTVKTGHAFNTRPEVREFLAAQNRTTDYEPREPAGWQPPAPSTYPAELQYLLPAQPKPVEAEVDEDREVLRREGQRERAAALIEIAQAEQKAASKGDTTMAAIHAYRLQVLQAEDRVLTLQEGVQAYWSQQRALRAQAALPTTSAHA